MTGIVQGQDPVNVFPHPATTSIQIQTKNPVERIELLTLSGRTLLDQEANPISNKLDLPQFGSGNYLLRVLLKNGRAVVRQVVIE
ncbi:T9SS type A sorting domain-containing protein [Dyadobacter soli]|uniref:T9SS type A sorting domain-containing protein n=1 Tax=Dyadobacter soli TaxID=659014 RepID=UPI00159F993F